MRVLALQALSRNESEFVNSDEGGYGTTHSISAGTRKMVNYAWTG